MWHLAILSALFIGHPMARCSISTLSHLAPRGAVVLAVATGERVMAPVDTADFRIQWHFDRPLPPSVPGQVFRVVQAVRDEGRLHEGGQLTVVPWSYQASCYRRVWTDASWVSAGDTVVFRLQQTRSSLEASWAVFDVLGWHEPYPSARFLKYEVRDGEADRHWLSATEYFEFLQVLPTQEQADTRPAEGLRQVEAWVRERPGIGEAFPVREIVDRWRRAAVPGG